MRHLVVFGDRGHNRGNAPQEILYMSNKSKGQAPTVVGFGNLRMQHVAQIAYLSSMIGTCIEREGTVVKLEQYRHELVGALSLSTTYIGKIDQPAAISDIKSAFDALKATFSKKHYDSPTVAWAKFCAENGTIHRLMKDLSQLGHTELAKAIKLQVDDISQFGTGNAPHVGPQAGFGAQHAKSGSNGRGTFMPAGSNAGRPADQLPIGR